jgi:aminodeoxyfutalosine deaminase
MDEGANRIRIHRAAWVIPVERPPIPDGAVIANGDTLIGLGTYQDLKARFPSRSQVVDHGDAALMPAVVNAHTHLELTALEGSISLPQEGFPSWVQQVFRLRACLDTGSTHAGFQRGLAMLGAAGTALCGDITNSGATSTEAGAAFPSLQSFVELIGFDCDSLSSALDRALFPLSVKNRILRGCAADGGPLVHRQPSFTRYAPTLSPPRGGSFGGCNTRYNPFNGAPGLQGDGMSLAAHAVYSTSAPVIEQAKDWCRSRDKVFSIHVAEHEQEMEFLRTGGGFCRELLTALGRWVEGWVPPGGSPVAYLDTLGVLDAKTLLVHAVHLSRSDWETLASRGCAVCFCPRSNHYLGAGKADVSRAIRMGIPAALGTDSLASNRDLNLFAEAGFLLDHWPDVSPDTVIAMMTMGGARALGTQDRFGSLAPGKSAAVITVPADPDVSVGRLSEMIIHKAREGAVQWALGPENV